MTVPLPPTLQTTFAAPPPPPAPDPVEFPLGWLLSNAAPPIQYRSLTEVARLTGAAERAAVIPMTYPPALELALTQAPDGTWNNAMLAVPSPRSDSLRGVGTIPAVHRLVEYGWSRESPPLVRARRTLFRLLAEDDDPAYLYELAPKGKTPDHDAEIRGRAILREAAAAALAHAGYEEDPRLRGAARRILDRITTYLQSPLAAKPWIRVGNQQVLAPEAAPPSIYALTMLAYMPLFRSEHHHMLDRVFQYISQPMPRQASEQLVNKKIVSQPHFILGDMIPHRNAVDADVPFALQWLELMARLNFLRRHEGWTKLFERFVEDRDRTGVWHPHKGMAMPRSSNPYAWPLFPLDRVQGGEERWSDVTFRIGLIARLAGRPIELI